MSNINNKDSYTAADSLPIKLFHDIDLIESITKDKKIIPRHIQLIPTNRCNLKCNFCSCENEDRSLELSYEKIQDIIEYFYQRGTLSCTISGGGETTLHPQINEIINKLDRYSIKIGLVTNGLLLHKNMNPKVLNKVTWCRISNGDFRNFTDTYKNNLSSIIRQCPDVDWAFSHVVSKSPNFSEIEKIVNFANDHNFTHVRLVADIFEAKNIDLDLVKIYLKTKNVDDSIVIYQGRNSPECGGDCYIGYLKPVIHADGKVYTCCGAQYAFETPLKKMPGELCFGTVKEYLKILSKDVLPFDGSICHNCYYMSYNRVLGALLNDLDHCEFI